MFFLFGFLGYIGARTIAARANVESPQRTLAVLSAWAGRGDFWGDIGEDFATELHLLATYPLTKGA